MSRCCNEPNCRRSKPMMLMRSDLTGAWYIVTAYTDLGGGHFRASAKHRLPDHMQDQLEDMRDGHAAAARADRLCDDVERVGGSADWSVSTSRLRAALEPTTLTEAPS